MSFTNTVVGSGKEVGLEIGIVIQGIALMKRKNMRSVNWRGNFERKRKHIRR